MSLKSTLLAFKKVVQVVQIWEWGGGCNLDKIQKNGSFFGTPTLTDLSRDFVTGNISWSILHKKGRGENSQWR